MRGTLHRKKRCIKHAVRTPFFAVFVANGFLRAVSMDDAWPSARGMIFHAADRQQWFSTFSRSQGLRRVGNGIIV
jgi:hypothetical protein